MERFLDKVRVPANQLLADDVERMLDGMAERVMGYLAGEHFEDTLHKLTCDRLGLSVEFAPANINETDPDQVIVQTAYFNQYAGLQMKVLGIALQMA